MNENKKYIGAYNNLLKILNVKNKQFEQNVFNDFLEDQNLRLKQGQSFDIDKCNEVIKESTNPKIKRKFNVVIDEISETDAPIKGNKPILKIKHNRSLTKDMYPKTPTFTKKIIAARGTGKTIFLIAFLHSLVNREIVKHEDIYIFCPTFNEHNQCRSSGYTERNLKYLNEECFKGKLLVFDDMQLDTKGNKLVKTLCIGGKHNKTGIIQFEQLTEATAHMEKANTDFFVLIPPLINLLHNIVMGKLCQL